MNVVHLSDSDIVGGASKATFRLHSALRQIGCQSSVIVREKRSLDDDVRRARVQKKTVLNRISARISQSLINKSAASYTYNYNKVIRSYRGGIEEHLLNASIINLHWIDKLLETSDIKYIYDKFKIPIVWTLMDEEPYTGGCHYTFGCEKFKTECYECHLIKPSRVCDFSKKTWWAKYRQLRDIPLVFVAGTRWQAERIKSSSLFSQHKILVIPLPVNENIFRVINKGAAREVLGIPYDKKVIFAGAASFKDERKGMGYLSDSLKMMHAEFSLPDSQIRRNDVVLLTAGNESKDITSLDLFNTKELGYITDDRVLALAYQSADLFVCPSVEDAGPLMIAEAMLCGIPVVAFNTGGAPDLIEHKRIGYLAETRDSRDLAKGIEFVLKISNEDNMTERIRNIALKNQYQDEVARSYLDMYLSL